VKVVILGTSGHSKVVIDLVERSPGLELVGLLDPVATPGSLVLGYTVLGKDADLARLIADSGVQGVVIAVGDNWLRGKIAARIREGTPDVLFPSLVHPSACLASSTRLGCGTVVMAGCVVNSDARVGEFCILNTNCSVDHETVIGNFASVAPGAHLGGNVIVGSFTAIGLGANVIHRVHIGEHTVVGAGATVVRSIPGHVVAYSSPARVVRPRAVGEPYL
jgi:sugar O-acyltransferase (sialic acid O-acetyltransferase NeuD family)